MSDIAIITTGGTIDKDYFDALSEFQVVDSPIEDLLKQFNVGCDYRIIRLMQKDSLELNDEDRALIKSEVLSLDAKNILITHGTDTMTQTAGFLSDVPDKTIVLTGAMKPARFKETDAIFNIGFALGALQTCSPGVYVAMSGQVFTHDKVKKDRSLGQFVPV